MLSPMAAEDIKALSELGVVLTPGQIVRLNALALQVEHGAEASSFVEAPRVAWAGKTPLFEPTIQMRIWIKAFASVWWHGMSLELAIAWACAHARKPGFFAECTDEASTRKAIEDWQRSLDCTAPQLSIALNYALNGIPSDPAPSAAKDTDPTGCPYADILSDALAANLGCGIGELSTQPRRIVADMLMRWMRNRVALAGGKADSLDARSSTLAYRDYDDYLQSLTPQTSGDPSCQKTT